jgi:hypothetical protein
MVYNICLLANNGGQLTDAGYPTALDVPEISVTNA